MYISARGDIVDLTEFIVGVYTDIFVSSLYMNQWHVAFEGHICCWHNYVYNMVNKRSRLLFELVCVVIWGLHVDYIIRLHDQIKHVAPHFNYLDPSNVKLPLMLLFTSHNANASTSGVT